LKPDPGQTPDAEEIEAEAGALADVVTDPKYGAEFGLVVDPEFAPRRSSRYASCAVSDRTVRSGSGLFARCYRP
jgi:hypothetical protein